MKWTRKLSTWGLSLSLGLSACTVAPPTTGQLRFSFQTPVHSQTQFHLQAIPAQTTRFQLEVSGSNLPEPIRASLNVDKNQSTQTHTLKELPAGPKTVKVQALENDKVLAEASQQVEIKAGEVNRVELELKAIVKQVLLELSEPLPLDAQLELTLSGEGLNAPKSQQLNLKANSKQLELGSLPPGNKQARLIFKAVNNSGQTITSEPISETFNVDSQGGGTLKISLDKLLAAYLSQIDALLSLSPLQILSLIQQLGPERLNELFAQLPADVQARLLQNPQVAAFITVRPSSSPSPTAEPQASAPSETNNLIADVRLALTTPEAPLLLMLTPPVNIPQRIRVLQAGQTHAIFPAQAWGLLVRSNYSGSGKVNYRLQLKRQDGNTQLELREGTLSQRLRVNERDFVGDVLRLRNTDAPVNLPVGNTYVLTLTLKNTESEETQSAEYLIRPVNTEP